jgi:hypothetical protein
MLLPLGYGIDIIIILATAKSQGDEKYGGSFLGDFGLEIVHIIATLESSPWVLS